MTERLKVLIYTDSAASSSIDTSIAHDGLKLISPNNSTFEVIDDSLKYTLKDMNRDEVTTPTIIADKTFLPLERGHFNIVLTNRAISWSDNLDSLSLGFAYNASPETGFALINVQSYLPETTVAHEAAHLMGMRYVGDSGDRDIHCDRTDCLMHGTVDLNSADKPLQRTNERMFGETFCPPCTEQLAIRAFVLASYIANKPVPQTWFDAKFFLPEDLRKINK